MITEVKDFERGVGLTRSIASPDSRYSRQASVVPEDKLSQHRVTVIGVGAIGRQVALQVTAIGAPWVQLIDFDHVDEVNLPVQGFREEEIGQGKVFAVAKAMKELRAEVGIVTLCKPFKASQLTDFGNVVFCCVDDIEIRSKIWKDVKDVVDVFIDGRMTAESLRVISVTDEESREYYPTTLFKSEEAYQGSCTAKSTIYCANIAAGVMVSQFTKTLRGIPVDRDVQLNLLSMEISVS